MGSKKKSYTDQQKQEAVRLVIDEGVSARAAGKLLGIHHTSIATWVRQYRKGGLSLDVDATVVDKDARIRQLERELARTRMERDFLKKATAFLEREQQ